MNRRRFLIAAAASAGALALGQLRPLGGSAAADEPAQRPNIVFLLADDLGWNDVSFNGSEFQTPAIDRVATDGVRLDQHYVMPQCTPTRGCLLTGRHPIRYGLQQHVININSQYGLALEERTLPQALKEVGYRTAILGKWHLGHHTPDYFPQNRGFDYQYGMYWGRIDYFTHEVDNPKHPPGIALDWHRDGKALREEGYSTKLIGQEAVRVVQEHDFSRPLFLYVPFNAPHGPTQAAPEFIERIKGISDPKRANYAAVVCAIDDAIAGIVAAIEKRGVTDNTLIVFTSDNGGLPDRGCSNAPLHGQKGQLYDGGIRVPTAVAWRGKLKPGALVTQPVHIVDWYPTFLKLAGASLEQKLPLDGMDIWPVLAEGQPSPHKEMLLNIEPLRNGCAIRVGDWKLYYAPGKEQNAANAELYNLAADPNETKNLASETPDKVKELKARLDYYAAQAAKPLQESTTPRKDPLPAVIGESGQQAAP